MATLPRPSSLAASYGRAALAAVPLAGRAPFLPGGGGSLPAGTRSLQGVRLDADRLRTLRELTSDHAAHLPLLAPHLLAFPLHMQAMTAGDFPFPAMGTVHLDNLVQRTRPIGVDEALDLEVSFAGAFPHKKGALYQIITTASAGGELVWREVSTMLAPGGKPTTDQASAPLATGEGDAPADASVTAWELPGDLGRRYGAVSGDRNPIHLHPATAKLFGFPRAIAHGMWTASRLAALKPVTDLPNASLAVRFEKPLLLPAKAESAEWSTAEGTAFVVRSSSGEKIHARALLSEAPASL